MNSWRIPIQMRVSDRYTNPICLLIGLPSLPDKSHKLLPRSSFRASFEFDAVRSGLHILSVSGGTPGIAGDKGNYSVAFKVKRTKELQPGVPDDRLYMACAICLRKMAPESVKPLIGLILGATASFSLSGCSANAGGGTEPALASESICLASRSFQRCQFEHYLAELDRLKGSVDSGEPCEAVLFALPDQAQIERAYLQAQLERFSGNISRTASFVGMERSALHRKLKSLSITADD